jgi:DeoR/GlpR family transcriptional regulator of sugar metabolism
MPADERRNRLLEMVRGRGFVSLPELASTLAVSESTVRRDLGQLEESGVAKRTHGGAYYTGPSPGLGHFEHRQAVQWEKKKAIARRALDLIDDGDTLLLDGGSTAYEVARLLVDRPLQVVTNSLPVANLFMASVASDLVVIGGYMHTRTGVLVGPHALKMLDDLNVRKAVLSIAAISEGGFYNSNLLLVEMKRAVMQAADEVIVVADSTKFGHKSLTHLCGWDQVDDLVVAHEITEDWRSKVIAAGVKLIVAGETDNG